MHMLRDWPELRTFFPPRIGRHALGGSSPNRGPRLAHRTQPPLFPEAVSVTRRRFAVVLVSGPEGFDWWRRAGD